MPREGRPGLTLRWLGQSSLALVLAGGVALAWPRLEVPQMGWEGVWFGLAWLIILAGPALAGLSPGLRQEVAGLRYTFEAGGLTTGTFLLGVLFLGLLLAAPHLGNYKLWLGVVYLSAVTLRLAGLTLLLRAEMLARPGSWLAPALGGAAISALAGLMIIPWLKPELTAHWPPVWSELGPPVLAALIWGAMAGAVLVLLRRWGGSQRTVWLTYLAVGLGPGPALAVAWLPIIPMSLALAALAGLALLRRLTANRPAPAGEEPLPLSLYWLIRALMLLWWGLGGALTLAAAWWQPRLGDLMAQSLWLRALGLGGFVVACVGLLAEYTLPLLGRPNWISLGRESKLPGVILSALALILALSPLLLTDPYENPMVSESIFKQARAELLTDPVRLGPDSPEVELNAPTWLTQVSRIFMVSLLEDAAGVEQGKPVAQLVVVDDRDFPHIFPILAGVDTAAWDLDRRDVAAVAQHGPARVATTWIVYTPTGEAFTARSYLAGLFLGGQVNQIKQVRLRYVYENPSGKPPLIMVVRSIFLN